MLTGGRFHDSCIQCPCLWDKIVKCVSNQFVLATVPLFQERPQQRIFSSRGMVCNTCYDVTVPVPGTGVCRLKWFPRWEVEMHNLYVTGISRRPPLDGGISLCCDRPQWSDALTRRQLLASWRRWNGSSADYDIWPALPVIRRFKVSRTAFSASLINCSHDKGCFRSF